MRLFSKFQQFWRKCCVSNVKSTDSKICFLSPGSVQDFSLFFINNSLLYLCLLFSFWFRFEQQRYKLHFFKGWVSYWFSRALCHNDDCEGVGRYGGTVANDFLKFRKVKCIVINLKVHRCRFLLLHLSNHRWKKIIYQCGCHFVSAAVHMYKWKLWTIHPFLVFSSRKNTRVKSKKIRNIQ